MTDRSLLHRFSAGCIAGVGALVLPLSLAAQILYVPVPDTTALEQTPQLTLRFNNPSAASRRVAVTFHAAGEDGTVAAPPTSETVFAGASTTVSGTALVNGSGLLAISGAPQVAASVEFAIAHGDSGSDLFLPVIAAANLIAAKSTALVAGLQRATGGGFANLEIVNLGTKSTQCAVALLAADGTLAAPGATITLPPLSLSSFPDVLSGGANPNPANVTAQVSCDQAFYPYATIYTPSPAALRIAVPSSALAVGVGASTSTGSGSPTPPSGPPAGPPGQPVSVTRSGQFFAPVDGDSVLAIPIPVTPGGSYSVATVEFDMLVGPFTPHYTAIAALLRPGSSRNNRTLYYGFDIRGNVGRTFIDLGVVGLEPAIKTSYPWTVGQLYHIKLIYDVVEKLLTLVISQDGIQEAQIQGANFNWDLRDTGKGIEVSMGLPGVADGAYFPPLGWLFSNLSVSMQP